VNKTQKTIVLSAVLILAFSLTLGGIILISAETEQEDTYASDNPVFRHKRGPRFMSMLSDEQRTELDEAIQAMREANATEDEIREYIENFLEENGVEFEPPVAPERPELSDEQLELLEQLREDVKSYAQQRAEELGLDLPEDFFSFGRGGAFHGPMRGHGFPMQPE
jgi:hypothetical protein